MLIITNRFFVFCKASLNIGILALYKSFSIIGILALYKSFSIIIIIIIIIIVIIIKRVDRRV